MLKRYQVLLPDWLDDYIKFGVDRYGISFSELIRLQVCLASLDCIEELHPEYKPNITSKDILRTMSESTGQTVNKDEVKRFTSRIYFETRKAIEYRYQKIKESS